MKTLITPLLLILFTLPSYASDLPPCPKDTYHNCFGAKTSATGNKYVGEFKNNKYHGNGTYTFVDGEKYVGEFKNGKRNGKGTNTWAAGAKYVGEWKDEKRNGKGTFTYPTGVVKSGIWADGKYLYSPEDKARDKAREESRLRASCAMDAGKAGTEYAAKQIEKTCLEDLGLKPKGWFDW